MLDVLFLELKVSPVAWASFREALGKVKSNFGKKFLVIKTLDLELDPDPHWDLDPDP